MIDVCISFNFPIAGLIITGGQDSSRNTQTSIETFPDDANCIIPPFPRPGRHDHSLSVVDNGRQLVACGGFG